MKLNELFSKRKTLFLICLTLIFSNSYANTIYYYRFEFSSAIFEDAVSGPSLRVSRALDKEDKKNCIDIEQLGYGGMVNNLQGTVAVLTNRPISKQGQKRVTKSLCEQGNSNCQVNVVREDLEKDQLYFSMAEFDPEKPGELLEHDTHFSFSDLTGTTIPSLTLNCSADTQGYLRSAFGNDEAIEFILEQPYDFSFVRNLGIQSNNGTFYFGLGWLDSSTRDSLKKVPEDSQETTLGTIKD
jgi:hypothetical protein